jgi:hypothetical protein
MCFFYWVFLFLDESVLLTTVYVFFSFFVLFPWPLEILKRQLLKVHHISEVLLL